MSINLRKRKPGTVGPQHRVTKEEAMKWFQQKVIYLLLTCLQLTIILTKLSLFKYTGVLTSGK